MARAHLCAEMGDVDVDSEGSEIRRAIGPLQRYAIGPLQPAGARQRTNKTPRAFTVINFERLGL